jgi:long-chain acyl-CoA synthetase
VNGYGMVELGGLAMMGIELSFSCRAAATSVFPCRRFKFAWPTKMAARCGPARRASARFAAAALAALLEGRPKELKGDALITSDGWLRTGDLATRNRLGMIRLVGRMKDVIKSGGYSVYVRELEEAIMAHPAVAARPPSGCRTKTKASFPPPRSSCIQAPTQTKASLLEWCRKNSGPYKAPRRIWILDSSRVQAAFTSAACPGTTAISSATTCPPARDLAMDSAWVLLSCVGTWPLIVTTPLSRS